MMIYFGKNMRREKKMNDYITYEGIKEAIVMIKKYCPNVFPKYFIDPKKNTYK